MIAAGAALLAFLGSRARLGDTAGLYPAEMVAAALMLAGFLLAGTLDKGVRKARAKRQAVGGRLAAETRRLEKRVEDERQRAVEARADLDD